MKRGRAPLLILVLMPSAGLVAQATPRTPAVRPPARLVPAMTQDYARRRIVLFGGLTDSGTFLHDTWEWNGSRWTRLATPVTPTARAYSALAYDAVREATLLFSGGSYREQASDTWAWTGARWMALDSGGGPRARGNHTMAADTGRRRIVLFGGQADEPLDDVWEWDGSSWIRVTPVNGSPAARLGQAMVYDGARSRVLLFGGEQNDTNYLNDTWAWDGTRWAEATLADSLLPPARAYHAMAYDPIRREVVLFGGLDQHHRYLGDTWVWDGSRWTLRTSLRSPAPRQAAMMAYDAVGGRVLLFGGEDEVGGQNDTWGWNGKGWLLLLPGTPRDTAQLRVAKALATMRTAIVDLAAAEREYFAKHGRYTGEVYDLWPDFKRPFNVYLQFTTATESGWAVRVTHGMSSRAMCGLYVGQAQPPMVDTKRVDEVTCRS
jgi:galactose oxidase-like protein